MKRRRDGAGSWFVVWIALLALSLAVFAAPGANATEPATSGIAESDSVGAAIIDALGLPGRLARVQRLSTIFSGLDAENFDEALEVVQREAWWLEPIELELFVEAWTRFDPESAVDEGLRVLGATRHSGQLPAAILAWALHDPRAAADKVEELAERHPRQRQRLVNALILGWVQSGQPGALEYAASLPKRAAFRAGVVASGQTRRLRVPAVLEWLDEVVADESDLLPAEFRRNLFSSVTSMGSRQDPVLVARWWKAHAGRPYAEKSAYQVLEQWLPLDAASAFKWAIDSVPADERPSALRNAFASWLVADFDSAQAFVEAAPVVPAYDPVFAAYVVQLAERDPEAAVGVAERIHDAQAQLESLETAATSWYKADSEKAEAWLSGSPLAPEARARVRLPPKGRKHGLRMRGAAAKRPARPNANRVQIGPKKATK